MTGWMVLTGWIVFALTFGVPLVIGVLGILEWRGKAGSAPEAFGMSSLFRSYPQYATFTRTELDSLSEWLSHWGLEGVPNWADRTGETVPVVKSLFRRLLAAAEFSLVPVESLEGIRMAATELVEQTMTTCPACRSRDGKGHATSWFHTDSDIDCRHPFHLLREALDTHLRGNRNALS